MSNSMNLQKTALVIAVSLGVLGAGAAAFAAGEPMVGGAPMYPPPRRLRTSRP